MIDLSRRSFLLRVGALVAAPAIVPVQSLMALRGAPLLTEHMIWSTEGEGGFVTFYDYCRGDGLSRYFIRDSAGNFFEHGFSKITGVMPIGGILPPKFLLVRDTIIGRADAQ